MHWTRFDKICTFFLPFSISRVYIERESGEQSKKNKLYEIRTTLPETHYTMVPGYRFLSKAGSAHQDMFRPLCQMHNKRYLMSQPIFAGLHFAWLISRYTFPLGCKFAVKEKKKYIYIYIYIQSVVETVRVYIVRTHYTLQSELCRERKFIWSRYSRICVSVHATTLSSFHRVSSDRKQVMVRKGDGTRAKAKHPSFYIYIYIFTHPSSPFIYIYRITYIHFFIVICQCMFVRVCMYISTSKAQR